MNSLLLISTTDEQNVLRIKYVHFFHKTSAPAMGPTGSPMQWIPGFLPQGQNGRGVKLTIHLHLVPRLRWVGLYLYPTYISHRGVGRENVTISLFREFLLICVQVSMPHAWQYIRFPNTPTNFTRALQYRI